jgi:photosystem II protein
MSAFTVTSASLVAPARLGNARAIKRAVARVPAVRARATLSVTAGTTSIQFVKGTDETSVPDVRLTRSKDGTNGTAFFVFTEPDVFEATELTGEITGMYLVDEEGELQTVDVNAKFLNGKPQGIEATYVMKTTADWNRFMRFMERYAEDNGLGFSAKK